MEHTQPGKKSSELLHGPLWYKDAVIYEVHVRAFLDTNGDGRGDFRGLTAKLDYIQDLGVTVIWLLPFYPSPWLDDGYDIANYLEVHPAYGTMRDFQTFLREAHRRGLAIISELVLNHTSDQHAWFQRSRRAKPGSRWRDFYVWSDTPDKYKEARIIFKDFHSSNWSWDPVANSNYWHRFYAHQPDLNYANPLVQRAMFRVVDFWLDQGIDGFRLDAISYLFEREGTNCENLPETHAYLKELRRHIDSRYENRMLLAEANLWPEDAISYLGGGDECQMLFHFPLMPRLFTAIRMEDRFPIVEILRQTPPIPENCQWALFLRNHDELTLEMVTDEERDYMYRVYAQDPQTRINLGIRRRLAPLLGNDRRRLELMNALLFSLPGTPVIYYGDEIGMGDNVYLGDRDGVRTPMQWSADRNAGFSQANPQRLYLPVNIDPEYHYEALNVEAQQHNSHALLWWMKRLIALRKQFKAFGWGTLEFLQPENRRVLAFIRRYKEECVLVIANLSRFVQAAELDLSEFKGLTPVEMFGKTELPAIAAQPYFLTLAPYSFYWLSLERRRVSIESVNPPAGGERQEPPVVRVNSWEEVFEADTRDTLSKVLPDFLQTRRWFLGRGHRIESIRLLDFIPIGSSMMILVRVEYADTDSENYLVLASFATGEKAERLRSEFPDIEVARLIAADGSEGVLYTALRDRSFGGLLLEAFGNNRRFKGEAGELYVWKTRAFRTLWNPSDNGLEPSPQRAEQTNNSLVYGERFILKLFRRLEPGIHPDLEIGSFLFERTSFAHIAPVAGSLEYRSAAGERITIGLLQAYVPHAANAWQYTLDSLSSYLERTQMQGHPDHAAPPAEERHPLELSQAEVPAQVNELIGGYLEQARLLGQRTAELHLALTHEKNDPSFAPEPFTANHRDGLYHSILVEQTRVLQLLRLRLKTLPAEVQADAEQALGAEDELRRRLIEMRAARVTGARIRVHGALSLSEALYTGKDFVIIDFEGRPERPLSERRIKRPPLRDVAGMLNSFGAAAQASVFGRGPGVTARPEDYPVFEQWAEFWRRWVSAAYLRGYLAAADSNLLPQGDAMAKLLEALLIEQAVYDLGRELSQGGKRLSMPLRALRSLVR
jgi:maltose alpha-D-glucosyltransferase/alpha-amylase